MDSAHVLANINKEIFSRDDILTAARLDESDYKNSQIRNLLEQLMRERRITRIARNKYTKISADNNKGYYKPVYSEAAENVIKEVEEKFPYITFQVWELMWLNEFMNHLLARNIIFLEVENGGCEFVFSALSEEHKSNMLLRPSAKELEYYSVDDEIIVGRLISESPTDKSNAHKVVIEKIIVDLFANKTLKSMVSQAEYADVLNRIFDKYIVDQSRLLRYAKRRNKAKEIRAFLDTNTNIKLLVEG